MSKIVSLTVLFCFGILVSSGQKAVDIALRGQSARVAPEWITGGVIYQIQPRAFTREGTIGAATSKLKDVADLGASIVYLCPVFVMDTDANRETWSPRQIASGMENPRNPYRIMDYFHVDPEFGSDHDLTLFVNEAHRLGLKVMLDMVYLHCGANAVFLGKHPEYVKHDKGGRQVTSKWHWPELNFDNLSLREYLYSNMAYWVTVFHVDGFRCDVADGVPIDFWNSVRDRLEVLDPDIAMLSEGERAEDQLKAFDINYGFTWFRVVSSIVDKDAAATDLRRTWERMTSDRPKGARFIRFIDTHDISNDSWYSRTEEKWGFRAVNAALVLNFTINGVPFIYNGEEVADKSRNSIFGDLPIDWSNGNTVEGKERHAFLKGLMKLRRNEKALSDGTLNWIDNSVPNSIVSFERVYGDTRILVVVNLKSQDLDVNLKLGNETVRPSFKTILTSEGSGEKVGNGLKMEGYGYWVGVYGK